MTEAPLPELGTSSLPIVYGGFWLRLVALLLDILLLSVLLAIMGVIMVWLPSNQHIPSVIQGRPTNPVNGLIESFLVSHPTLFFFLWITVFVAQWLYFAVQESGIFQATYGKRLLRLKVTDLEGHPISFSRATGRYFAKMLSLSTYIGGIMAAFMPKKQALHDLMASTLVVRN